MRAVVQRVNYGRVTIEGRVTADIGKGLVILLGVGPDDTEEKISLAGKKDRSAAHHGRLRWQDEPVCT